MESIAELVTNTDDDFLTIIFSDDITAAYDYKEVEDPANPGSAFASLAAFESYLTSNI